MFYHPPCLIISIHNRKERADTWVCPYANCLVIMHYTLLIMHCTGSRPYMVVRAAGCRPYIHCALCIINCALHLRRVFDDVSFAGFDAAAAVVAFFPVYNRQVVFHGYSFVGAGFDAGFTGDASYLAGVSCRFTLIF